MSRTRERGRAVPVRMRERERERVRETWEKNEKRNKHLVLIMSENGVLVFKQCHLSKNYVQVM